jgi:hypothetical protein
MERVCPMGSKTATKAKQKNSDPLVGKFFHSFTDDRKLSWQGTVLKHVRGGFYLVQLFEWFFGEPSAREVVSLERMAGWSFYDTAEEMREAYADYDHRSGRNAA